jgi:hypothetical protein
MKTLIAALTLGALVVTPAFARVHGSHVGTGKVASSKANHADARKAGPQAAYAAVTPFGSPTASPNAQTTVVATREAALRECSIKSRQYTETTWGSMQMHGFRTCMMQHGEQE